MDEDTQSATVAALRNIAAEIVTPGTVLHEIVSHGIAVIRHPGSCAEYVTRRLADEIDARATAVEVSP